MNSTRKHYILLFSLCFLCHLTSVEAKEKTINKVINETINETINGTQSESNTSQIIFSSLKEQLIERFTQNIRSYRLENGVRIILMKNNTTPTIACYLKIGVGSSNEPFDISGTAHFLEHLLFKGNQTLGTKDFQKERKYIDQLKLDNERVDTLQLQLLDPLISSKQRIHIQQRIEKLKKRIQELSRLTKPYIISEEYSTAYSSVGGVAFNAYTSADITNYQVSLPSNQLNLWAYLESERFVKPQFREFYQERKVILEERRMRYDSKPNNLLYEVYLKIAFGFSPYGKPVIGFANKIPRLSWNDTLTFFEKNYIPSRMVIAIVGDVDFERDLAIIKKYFSSLQPKTPPPFPPIQHENTPGRRTKNLIQQEAEPFMITGWYTPSIHHPDYITISIFSEILASGQSSRLFKRLVEKEKLVRDINAISGLPGSKLPNISSLLLTPLSTESYNTIYNIINQEIENIFKNGITQQELQKIKNNWLRSIMRSLDSNAGLADKLSYYELLLNDHLAFLKYFDHLDTLSSKDIQNVIQKYFKHQNNVTVWLNFPAEKPKQKP